VERGTFSDDGKQIWDGTAWHVVSDDRHWWWDGGEWQPVSGLTSQSVTDPSQSQVQASDGQEADDGEALALDAGDENEPDVEIAAPPDAGYRLSPTGLVVSPGGQWWWNGKQWHDLVKKPSESKPVAKGPKLGFGQTMQMISTLAEVKKAIADKGSLQALESQHEARNNARQGLFAAVQASCPLSLEPSIRPLPGGIQLFPDEFLVSVAKDYGFSSQRLTITTHRLIYTRGRMSKVAESMYLQDVRDVKYIKPTFGLGRIAIENAAGVSSLEGLPAVMNASKLRNDIMAMVHFARQRAQAPTTVVQAPVAPAPAPEDIPAKLKQLAALHDSGILTDAEFQAKKTELLSRL